MLQIPQTLIYEYSFVNLMHLSVFNTNCFTRMFTPGVYHDHLRFHHKIAPLLVSLYINFMNFNQAPHAQGSQRDSKGWQPKGGGRRAGGGRKAASIPSR